MEITIWLFFVLLNGLVNTGICANEHVHFKIHVPAITKHQIHTKTVFIHVPKLTPKKKIPKPKQLQKIHRLKEENENWNSWSSYDHRENKYTHDKNHFEDHAGKSGHYGSKKAERANFRNYSPSVTADKGHSHGGLHKFTFNHNYSDNLRGERQKFPTDKDYTESYFPESNSYNEQSHNNADNENREIDKRRKTGYSGTPQYAVRENIEYTHSNDVNPYDYKYEKGYRKGSSSQTDHLIEDHSNRFEDTNHEEENESEESYDNTNAIRTHTGRYLVDDTEYENHKNQDSNNYRIARK